MTAIRVTYHHEDGAWWADSPDLDGWVAGGDTLAEARVQAREGIKFFVGPHVEVLEGDIEHPVVVRRVVISGASQAWLAGSTDAPAPVTWQPRYEQARATA